MPLQEEGKGGTKTENHGGKAIVLSERAGRALLVIFVITVGAETGLEAARLGGLGRGRRGLGVGGNGRVVLWRVLSTTGLILTAARSTDGDAVAVLDALLDLVATLVQLSALELRTAPERYLDKP